MDLPVFNFGASKTHLRSSLVHIVILFIFVTIINCQNVTKEHVDNTKLIKLDNGNNLDRTNLIKLKRNNDLENVNIHLGSSKNVTNTKTIQLETKNSVDKSKLIHLDSNSNVDKYELIQKKSKNDGDKTELLKSSASLDNTKLNGLENGINGKRDTKPVTSLLHNALLGNQAIFDVLNTSRQEQSPKGPASTVPGHVPAINMSLSTWSIAQPSPDNSRHDSRSVPIVRRKLPTPSPPEKPAGTVTANKNETTRESQSRATLPVPGSVNVSTAGIVIPMAKLLRSKRQAQRRPSQASAAEHQRVLMLMNPTQAPLSRAAARQRMTFLTGQQTHPLYNITNSTGLGGLGEHSSEPRLTTLIAKRPAGGRPATKPKAAVQSVSDLNLVDLTFPLIARNDQVGPARNTSHMAQMSHGQTSHGSHTGENKGFHTAVQQRAGATGGAFFNPRRPTRPTRPTRPSPFQVTRPTPHSNPRILNLRLPGSRQNPGAGGGARQPAALAPGRRPTPRLTFVQPVSGQRISSLGRTPGRTTSSRTSRTSGTASAGTLPRTSSRATGITSSRMSSRTLGRSPVGTSGVSSVRTSGRTLTRTPVGGQVRTAVRASVGTAGRTLGRTPVRTVGRTQVGTLGRTPVRTLGRTQVGTSSLSLGRPSIGTSGRTLGRSSVGTLGRTSVRASPGSSLGGARVRALVRGRSSAPVRRAGQSQPTTRSRATGTRRATPTQQRRQQRTRPARRPSRPDPFTQRFSAGFQRGSRLLHQPPMDFTSFDGTQRDNLGNLVGGTLGGAPQPPGFMNNMAMPGNIPFPGVGPGMLGGGGMFLGGPPGFL